MRTRNIIDLAVLFIIGFFMFSKLSGIGRIIGFLFVSAGVILLIVLLKDRGIIRKRSKESKEDEIDERDVEIIRQAEKIENLEKYDVDSGKGYCPHCGNYAVTDSRCEVCGEKVTE